MPTAAARWASLGGSNSKPTLTPNQTELVDLQLVGSYALAPTWADGHHTGFHTFERLRAACPCAEDEARRAADPHAQHVPGGVT